MTFATEDLAGRGQNRFFRCKSNFVRWQAVHSAIPEYELEGVRHSRKSCACHASNNPSPKRVSSRVS